MAKKRPVIKSAVIKAKKEQTKRTVPRAAKALPNPVLPSPEVAEPLTVPQDNVADHCVDSRLTIDGSVSAPTYPDVPAAEPAVEPPPSPDAAGSKDDQQFLTARFSQIVVRRTLSISKSMEESTTFTLTGVAAFIGLAIGNAGGLREVVSENAFKAGIILFIVSLLIGALSKILGAVVSAGVATVKELESELSSTDGADLMQRMTATSEQVSRGIAGTFPWPISILFESASLRGSRDLLTSEKIYTRLFFAQMMTNLLHWFFGISAILVIAFSMAGRS